MSKSMLGIVLIVVGLGMMGFLTLEVLGGLAARTPAQEAVTLLEGGADVAIAASATMSNALALSGATGLRQAQESYCLWPNDTLFDIAQYAGVGLEAVSPE